MATILHLPEELLTQIAIHLSWRDLIHLQQTCTSLLDVVQSNAALQYIIELHVAGRIDNSASSLVPGERLRILREKERAWRDVDLSDRKVLPLRHHPSGIYDLTGGVLLLGERRHSEGTTGTESVHTVRLHSAFGDQATSPANKLWSHLDLGRPVIDVGLAIQEHDLIAIVTYSYINEAQLWASIDIHLIKHSTGQPHPAAAKPVLHFDNIHYLPGHSSIMLEVSGDTLCFLLNNYFPFVSADPVTLVIFNWKSGHAKVGQKRLYSDPTMFNSFVLLSPDTVAFPIIPSNSIEICNFAEELAMPPPPEPTAKSGDSTSPQQPDVPLLKTNCTLELPPLRQGALVLRMTCRCEPNPLGPTTAAANVDTITPFYSDPTKAVMILHLHVRLPLTTTRVYTMLVHRPALLRVARGAIEAHTRARVNAEGPTPPSSASTLGSPSLPFVAAFQPNIHAPNFNPVIAPVPHGDDDDEVAEEPPSVPWAEWGPQHTRWFQDEFPGTRWITTTCGQRFVRVRGDRRLHVYDFNQRAMRRLMIERALAGEPVGSRPGEKVIPPEAKEVSEWGETEEGAGGGLPEFDDDDDDDEDLWMEGLEENAGFDGVGLLAPVDDLQDGMDELALLVPDDGEDSGIYVDTVNGEATTVEVDGKGKAASSEANHPQAELASGHNGVNGTGDPKVLVEVMLGKTVIGPSSAWEGELESALPYIERSVAILDDYESALVDEDIIVGLKMDIHGRHIKEVILHRIGGPAY